MNRFLIVADDITGANDTGVQLTRRGIETVVTLNANQVGKTPRSYVLNTESRALKGQQAFEKVSAQAKEFSFDGFAHLIKKIDSTLRGSVAHEVLAIDKAFGSELVVFMPALPALGRTTENGIHMLSGKRITQTEIAKDPKTPVAEDNLKNLLKTAYEEEITHIYLADIDGDRIDFGRGRVFTADATTNSQMEKVVASALKTGKKILWVGSAGIVDSLMQIEIPQNPALALVASVSETSRGQVSFAEDSGARLVTVHWKDILDGSLQSYLDAAVGVLSSGRDCILVSSASRDRTELENSFSEGSHRGLSTDDVSMRVRDGMGEIAAEILKAVEVSGMFLTGGDAAMGFFEKIGANSFEIVAEVLVGIPLMKISGTDYDGMKVITKAGAFGQSDAISFCLRKLRES